jgi:hypothetical protein
MSEERQSSGSDSMVYGLALAVALIAGVTAVLSATGDEDEPPPPRAMEAPAREAPAEPEPETAEREPEIVPDLPTVPDLENEPPPAREPGAPDPRFAELGAEMRMLSRARELLEGHPAEALGVLEQHRRRHPDGALREEREAFAIEALVALEHVDEAERRYYEFLRDFPDSDFRSRLERLMQRPPHEVGAVGR